MAGQKPKNIQMKRPFLFVAATAWLSLSLSAADSNPKDEIKAAAKALGEKPNYSWRSTMVVPADSPFKPGTDRRPNGEGRVYQPVHHLQ